MNRLRLEVDEVEVESFVTIAEEAGEGALAALLPSGLKCTRLTDCPCTPLAA